MILQQEIPYGYAHCFAGKDNCPKADSCLRAIAAKLLTESKEPQPETVNTVNAMYREQLTDQASCPLYRSSEPLRYAKGHDPSLRRIAYEASSRCAFQSHRLFLMRTIFLSQSQG